MRSTLLHQWRALSGLLPDASHSAGNRKRVVRSISIRYELRVFGSFGRRAKNNMRRCPLL